MLGLLRLLSYHYAAAAMSVPADRHVDSLRVLTAAAMAAMADAAARIVAVDIPSPFSLHYAGVAAGPSAPFGFTMRKFAQEAEALPITFPEHVTALTQVGCLPTRQLPSSHYERVRRSTHLSRMPVSMRARTRKYNIRQRARAPQSCESRLLQFSDERATVEEGTKDGARSLLYLERIRPTLAGRNKPRRSFPAAFPRSA